MWAPAWKVRVEFCGSFVLRYIQDQIRCTEAMFVHVCYLEAAWFKCSFSSNRYKSNEDYVYVRGRGRGKYICEECGIRCKKPSMLKKHIRTHTDVRPYVCKLCNFAFKTKGTWPFLLNFCHFPNKSWAILPSGIQSPFSVKERSFFKIKWLCLWVQDSMRDCSLLLNLPRNFMSLRDSLDSFIKSYWLLTGPSVCRKNLVA